MENKSLKKTLGVILVVGVFSALSLLTVGIIYLVKTTIKPKPGTENNNIQVVFNKFEKEEKFNQYISQVKELNKNRMIIAYEDNVSTNVSEDKTKSSPTSQDSDSRYSSTNVQVQDIDEADYLKLSKDRAYYSQTSYGPIYYGDCSSDKCKTQANYSPSTYVFDTSDPSKVKLINTIKYSGELLLTDEMLIIIDSNYRYYSGKFIYGFSLEDINNGKTDYLWKIEVDSNTQIFTVRLFDENLYVVFQKNIRSIDNCVYPLYSYRFEETDKLMNVNCVDIYYPESNSTLDVVYTFTTFDTLNGEQNDTTSYMGKYNNSVVYMNKNNMYLTFSSETDNFDIVNKFIDYKPSLFPASVEEPIKKLKDYDISDYSKEYEMNIILNTYWNSMSNEDRINKQNEISKYMSDFIEENKRDLINSVIVQLDIDDMTIENTGIVPGFLLNQFSMDEYEGYLRVATTIERLNVMWSSNQSLNDVYVFNSKLEQVGSVEDLGKGERVYSVRFVGNRGYVVTFRQIDPLYVLDLSDPESPELKGELEMPGYSTYLHPISEDVILGVGKEDWRLKTALYDVSDPENPKELSKLVLDTSYSEAETNHHAFMIDSENEYFFLPSYESGYIIGYEDNKLVNEESLEVYNVKRAGYIGEYLWVFSEPNYSQDIQVNVYQISDWEKVE